MKRITIAGLLLASLVSMNANAQASEPHQVVIVNVEGLHPHVAEQVRTHAAKGPIELRRFLERTNMIHRLRMEDVVKPADRVEVTAQRPRDPAKEVVVAKGNRD